MSVELRQVWTDPTNDPAAHAARVDAVRARWPELAEALDALRPPPVAVPGGRGSHRSRPVGK